MSRNPGGRKHAQKSSLPKPAGRYQKPGSKSPKHRGYRSDEAAAPKKQRWTAEERAERGRKPGRPRGAASRHDGAVGASRSGGPGRPAPAMREPIAESPARADRRPNWEPRQKSAGSRRSERPTAGSASSSRGQRRGFPERGKRVRDSSYYPTREATPFKPQDDVVLERLEAAAIEATATEGLTFESLGLGANIVRVLGELGAAQPFPIQAATIPEVLAGKDVLGRGRTGSGKTIAFGAPLVERLLRHGAGTKRRPGRAPRALILAPTRELALQIDRTVQPIARSVGLFTTQIYGGVPQARQVGALQRGVDIVIGTPGRIEDLIEQGRLDLGEVVVSVLDEADHMCDLGFLEPVQRILRRTAPSGQRLLFSATLDTAVAALVGEFLDSPSVHEVAGEDQISSGLDHRVLLIDQRDKRAILEQLAAGPGKTLVFARTRAFAEQLADDLDDAGIPAVSLHGDLNQAKRTRNLERLTSGRVRVLVATDVAARGIHVDDISLVVQADAPDEYKTYLHRAGRTGRAGRSGTVVTLVNRNRRRRMAELLGRAEIEATWTEAAPGDETIAALAAT